MRAPFHLPNRANVQAHFPVTCPCLSHIAPPRSSSLLVAPLRSSSLPLSLIIRRVTPFLARPEQHDVRHLFLYVRFVRVKMFCKSYEFVSPSGDCSLVSACFVPGFPYFLSPVRRHTISPHEVVGMLRSPSLARCGRFP